MSLNPANSGKVIMGAPSFPLPPAKERLQTESDFMLLDRVVGTQMGTMAYHSLKSTQIQYTRDRLPI